MNKYSSSIARALKRIGGIVFGHVIAFQVLILTCISSFAADLIYINRDGSISPAAQRFRDVSDFLGLSLVINGLQDRLDEALQAPDVLAVLIDADVLPFLDRKAVLASLHAHGRPVPLMIVGVNERTDRSSLEQWSNGAVAGAAKLDVSRESARYEFAPDKDAVGPLAQAELPFPAGQAHYLIRGDAGSSARELSRISDRDTSGAALVRISDPGDEVYLAAQNDTEALAPSSDPFVQPAVFARLADAMLFLHAVGGDRVWRSPAQYANLTIDDPWLRQPYGNLDYKQLLAHARSHNFFSTIGFIPWNFDRSETGLASLFRNNPDRLSISIHGNDHIRQEFDPSVPLKEQGTRLQQALARMERFRALASVQYDTAFIFPYSIGSEALLTEMRKRRFLGTVNTVSVPIGATAPVGVNFALRTATTQFAHFPSLRRYWLQVDLPQAQVAIDAFLGNPILFFAHEDFFSDGMGAFDKIADTVNRLEPATEWKSLGYIIQHLYLEKRRYDGRYELRAFSSELSITNNHGADSEYILEKDEDFSCGVTVLIDGTPASFVREGDRLKVSFKVQSGATVHFSVRYKDEAPFEGVDISRNSLGTNVVRLLSDFRDNVISRSAIGRGFVESYNEHGGAWRLLVGLVVAASCGALMERWRRRRGDGCG